MCTSGRCSWALFKNCLRPLCFSLHSWCLKSFLFWRLSIPYRTCFFHSCIFHPYYLLLHFPLLHFPSLLSTPAFSTPAFSTPAFSTPAFSAPPARDSLQGWYCTVKESATVDWGYYTTYNVAKLVFSNGLPLTCLVDNNCLYVEKVNFRWQGLVTGA